MQDPKPNQQIGQFLRFGPDEECGREYLICQAGFRRWTFSNIVAVLVGLCFYIVPGVILLLYFAFRRLNITYGYGALTNDRLIYYEANDHPKQNFRAVREVALRDITAIKLLIGHSALNHQFVLTVWTASSLTLAVGAQRGIFTPASAVMLEPGPDADAFMQHISALVAQRQSLQAAGAA